MLFRSSYGDDSESEPGSKEPIDPNTTADGLYYHIYGPQKKNQRGVLKVFTNGSQWLHQDHVMATRFLTELITTFDEFEFFIRALPKERQLMYMNMYNIYKITGKLNY